MTETRSCPQCGTGLPESSPEGPCPSCHWSAPERTTPPAASEAAFASTAAYQSSFHAPPVAEVARHFPQLEVIELLGQGGMGAVYKARQPALDRLVALKILPPAWGRDPAFAERFGREARAMARLSHCNIVIVYDSGQANGLYYLLMEFVDGENLRRRMRGGRLTPADVLTILPQICDGLQFAHDEGVIHRDIKPENILLDQKGRVKIADFGLAKHLSPSRSELTLTAPHQIMGTLHYMAPEQMERPREVDHRADIYSLGVVCYEMLTGELPIGRFELPSEKARVDPSFDQVIVRSLAKDPARRFSQARELKAVLTSTMQQRRAPPMVLPVADEPVTPRPVKPEVNLPLAMQIVKGPARGLIAVGILNLILLALLWTGQVASWFSDADVRISIPSKSVGLPALGISVLMILGGLRMRRLESYRLVQIGSIVALIPVPCCLSLPIGILAFTTLNKVEVKQAFAARPGRAAHPGRPGSP